MIDPFSHPESQADGYIEPEQRAEPTLEDRLEMNEATRDILRERLEELHNPRVTYGQQSEAYLRTFQEYLAVQSTHLQLTEYMRSLGK